MPRGNFSIFIPLMGCPYHCIYCDQHKISGQSDMSPHMAAEILRRDMPAWSAHSMTGQIAFFGGTFTGLPLEEMRAYLSSASPYVEQGLAQGIRISTRPDCISPEILRILKEYNVTHIELGVQSLDDAVLHASGRSYTAADVAESARLIVDFGFVLGMQMMPGLPGDTVQKSVDTARAIIDMGAKETRIYPTVVIRDTPLADLYETGKYQPLELDTAIVLTAKLKEMFHTSGVTVLKVGLHSGTLEKDVLAGPYHPAFGQLVNSRVCLERLIAFCEQNGLRDTPLYILPQDFDASDIVGQHRCNATHLKEKYGISIKISKNVLTNQNNSIIL